MWNIAVLLTGELRGRGAGREQQMQRESVEDCAEEGEMFRDEKDCVCLCTHACMCI